MRRRTRRDEENTFFDPRGAAKDHEEHLFVRGGRGGPRRTSILIREGTRRGAKGREEYQWRIWFSLCDCAALGGSGAVLLQKIAVLIYVN